MKLNNVTIFKLSSKITELEHICSVPMTLGTYHRLSSELDHTLAAATELEMEQMKQRVVDLYGKLEESRTQGELKQIHQDATDLTHTLHQRGRCSAHAVRKLEQRIQAFKGAHRPLSQDRRIIQEAEVALQYAKRPSGQEPLHAFLPTSPAAPASSDLDPAVVYELLDIARCVYEGNKSSAKRAFALLDAAIQERFEEQMKQQLSIAFEESVPTIKALVMLVNEIVGNGQGSPSNEEIDELFLMKGITPSGESQTKIISIDFNSF